MEKGYSEKPVAPPKEIINSAIQRESDSKGVHTIKEDIPSSVAQRTRSKKRKLSQISTSSVASKNKGSINISSTPQADNKLNNDQLNVRPNVDVNLSPQRNSNGSDNPLNNGQGHVEPNNDFESILNSEIYQIYCRAEDPLEAAYRISEHNSCVLFKSPKGQSRTEDGLKSICERTLKKLWKEESGETKFERVKKFIDGTIKDEVMGYSLYGESMRAALNYHFTKIQAINPNGYEYFYVRNFKMGHHNRGFEVRHPNVSSEWYRAESYESGRAQRLAQLRVMGITDSTLDQLQLNHYLEKNSTNMKWMDLAQRIINRDCLNNQDLYDPFRLKKVRRREGMFYLRDYFRFTITAHGLN